MTDGMGIFLASLVAALSGALTLLLKYYMDNRELKEKLSEITNDIRTDVSLSLPDLNRLDSIVGDLMKKTSVDRFVIFKAENGGKTPLTFTSAILERHAVNMYMMLSVGATSKYVRVRFDNDYLDLLKSIENTKGGLFLDVKEMRTSDLKTFYQDEHIKHSAIYFQQRHVIEENKHVILYYSFATHSEFKFTDKEKNLIKLAAYNIASLNFNITRIN